jgi:hypothetical protein
VSRTSSLLALVVSLLLVGAAYASAFLPSGAPAWAPWALLVGSVVALLAISLLGTGGGGVGGGTGQVAGAEGGEAVGGGAAGGGAAGGGANPASARAPVRLLIPLGAVFVLLVGGVGAGLLIPDPAAGDALYGGLPAGAAFLLYGAGILPLLVVPLAYAWVFPAVGFGEGELERVRDRALEAAAGGVSDTDDPDEGAP